MPCAPREGAPGLESAFPPDWERRSIAAAELGLFAVHAASRRVVLDDRAASLLGIDAAEVGFEKYLQCVESAHRERVGRHLAAVLEREGSAYHDEFRTQGARWISVDGRVRREGPGRAAGLFGVLVDVTLRRTTDDARARLIDEMARSLRFSDLLVGVASRSLQASLAAIAAAATDLTEESLASPAIAAKRIRSGAEEMRRVVAEVAELTRARLDGQIPLTLRPTDLAPIIRRLASDATSGERSFAIHVDTRADTTCTCDAERTEQLLRSLIVSAKGADAAAREVRVLVDGTPSRTISITVEGPAAIPPELTPTLFNPFRRARAEEEGHGLGLSLYVAQRIALGHGGDIRVVSTKQAGTCFRVELPRIASSASFSLTPNRAEEEAANLGRLEIADAQSRVTAALFGALPMKQRTPRVFETLVERHARVLERSLERLIYREGAADPGVELRALAEQLGALGASAGDVAELHALALNNAVRGAPPLKVQALASEGRLLALELMGRLAMFYRRRSGFGLLGRGDPETT